jgi:hypothetical protein
MKCLSVVSSRSGPFTPGEKATGRYLIGDFVGRRADPEFVEKREISCSCRDSNSEFSTIQPVARSLAEFQKDNEEGSGNRM